jgi:hypothetical protein
MSCPAWEDCNKKACIENYECVLYPPSYWKRIVEERKQKTKLLKKKARTNLLAPCVRNLGGCDKKGACAILGQCIIEVPRIAANQVLVNALKGPLEVGEVIKILREHDPEPMRSYYLGQKKKM